MNALNLFVTLLYVTLLPISAVNAQQVFVVNSTGDEPDLTPGFGCATAQLTCTLRAAIQEANFQPNGATPDLITFDAATFSGPPKKIHITGDGLPPITDPVIIDGQSAPGEIVVLGAPGIVIGIHFALGASGSELKYLTVGNFDLYGVAISAAEGVAIENNYIGVSRAGKDYGNGRAGLEISTNNTRIGGIGKGNVIGFNDIGVRVEFGSSHYIRGNYIGTDPEYRDVGNATGILIDDDATNVVVGGSTRDRGNVIGLNTGRGISSGCTSGCVIRNNHIGTNEAGANLGNGADGIYIDGPNHKIGGNKALGNVIGHNGANGINLQEGNTTIKGNYIGVNEAGLPMGNLRGLYLFYGYTIDNQIGYAADALIDPAGDKANIIAYNDLEGILIEDYMDYGPYTNTIRGNQIYDNGQAGIDLVGAVGTDPNDVRDADTGPNTLINYPDVIQVGYNGSFGVVAVEYSISSDTLLYNYPLTVDVYIADDPVSGEGRTFIGSDTYATQDAVQLLDFPATGFTWASDDVLVLTTTDADGNTSEFSPASAEIGGPGHTASATFQATPQKRTNAPGLTAPYPNPFTLRSTFTVTPEADGPVRIALFDVLGREVQSIYSGPLPAGSPTLFTIGSPHLPAGMYWIRVETPTGTSTRSVIVHR